MMEIQLTSDKNTVYNTSPCFAAKIIKLRTPKPVSSGLLNAGAPKTSASDILCCTEDSTFTQFTRELEPKLIARNKAGWEYSTTRSLWAGLKAYTTNLNYNIFINKKKNRENYIKLYGQQDDKIKNPFARFVDFLRQFPLDIYRHRIIKKELRQTGTIDGKEISQYKLSTIMVSETDPELREKAYIAKSEIGNSLKDYIIGIVKKRNSIASHSDYSSYFDQLMKNTYETDLETFNDFLNVTYLALKPGFKKVFEENDNKLKQIFKTDKLESYHYNLHINPDEYNILNETVAKYGTVQLAKKIYSKMGFDIDKLIDDGKLILYEDKSPKRAFHMTIIPGKQSGICIGLSNDFYNLLIFCHELGHAMYNLGLSQSLPLNIKRASSIAMNEAIAIMMSDIAINENVLEDIVPANILEKIRETRQKEKLITIAKNFAITEFEQEMYSNPNQDLAKLWQKKLQKFTGYNCAASNEWATLDYFISCPVRMHVYIKANMMAAQLYKHLKDKLGTLTENNGTANYLNENIFSKGASMSESELLKEITGKEFAPEDFVMDI